MLPPQSTILLALLGDGRHTIGEIVRRLPPHCGIGYKRASVHLAALVQAGDVCGVPTPAGGRKRKPRGSRKYALTEAGFEAAIAERNRAQVWLAVCAAPDGVRAAVTEMIVRAPTVVEGLSMCQVKCRSCGVRAHGGVPRGLCTKCEQAVSDDSAA